MELDITHIFGFTFSDEQQNTIGFASILDISIITFIWNNTVTLLATLILNDHQLFMIYIFLTMLTIKKTIVALLCSDIFMIS